ncbi:TonB-dependent receptor [Gammaproteobacteria bacterium]|nr:TonB-dependent receptor [Gammaproteobacteria bacterium]
MSRFLKISLALVGSLIVSATAFAQSTIEEVIVTAQRTEQSLQTVPIAVSAFTSEALEERQIEVSSDLQLQVPGITFSASTFSGGGGFSIRGITNFATAASADAGVEIHMNGMPLGTTSANEVGFLDMERIEVLRGPQGTLFGRNSTGGVINLITARPDLDAFSGTTKLQYASDGEKLVNVMLNVPISDSLGARFAFRNFERDGITKNLYSKSTNDFDSRDNYQWRASFLWEATDDLSLTLIHEAYDEESNRQQISGSYCETASSIVQGCLIGGKSVFQAPHPMSNASTLPALAGGALGYYFPNVKNGTTDTTKYVPLNAATGWGLVDSGTRPQDFFEANVWKSPTHDVQESTSQLILENDFDEGTLTVAYNNKKRQFYRDLGSSSDEAIAQRLNPALFGQAGLPMGYSNEIITPDCSVDDFKAGVFCGPQGMAVNPATGAPSFNYPVTGDASYATNHSRTTEIKYVSDMDGMFNFLIGAIDISNNTSTGYNVYASGISLNGYALPATLQGTYRDGYGALIACAGAGVGVEIAPGVVCDAGTVSKGLRFMTTAGKVKAAKGYPDAVPVAYVAADMVARIDGTYTEFFNNDTADYALDAQAIFTEFYFDVADNHKLTLGLRYNEDRKAIKARATFYEIALISDWNADAIAAGCGIQANGTFGSFGIGANLAPDGTFNAACQTAGNANTIGQTIGLAPVPVQGAAGTGAMPIIEALDPYNDDYTAVGYDPIKNFSATTGRLVWDWQATDDVLMFISYAKGFKGGGFNPAFNPAEFPNTPFAFDSTDVDAFEIGVKAAVPEVGLIANASIYYNDFTNFHVGAIRNQTAINEGIPLENMGAELELYLTPPSVPGLSFNMAFSYQDSELGAFKNIDPTDVGGHLRGDAASKNWHLAKNVANATHVLVDRDATGYTFAKVLQTQLSIAGATALAGAGLTGAAKEAAEATATQNTIAALMPFNEIAYAMGCTKDSAAAGGCDVGGAGSSLEASDLLQFLPFELSKTATAYGTNADVCYLLGLSQQTDYSGNAGPNTCLPVAAGGTPGVAPASTLIYSPQAVQVNGTTIAGPDGTLLPSVAVVGSGPSAQSGGVCKLFNAMVAHADTVTGNGTGDANELSYAANATCANTAAGAGQFVTDGLQADVTGNQMPFADTTLSLGIAYTAQAGDLEITPRLDYYYRSDSFNTIYNIEATKTPAWDEINFSLNIVPTNADWNVRFWVQNLTDERNLTGTGYTADSQSFTLTAFVREPRSFGMSFGLSF